MPFPGWGEFEGPDSADLDDSAKQAIASAAIPVPEGVTGGAVRLADERRYDVPVVLICPEFTPALAREWVEQGEVPELAKSKNVVFADIDSGHWPMISAPAELARLLAPVPGGVWWLPGEAPHGVGGCRRGGLPERESAARVASAPR